MAQQGHRAQFSRVLLIEDNPAQLSTLNAILEEEGFSVIGCSTAQAAFEHIQHGQFGVAVLDWRLPDMSGTPMLERFRELNDTIRIIINTAYGSFNSAKDAVNLGAFAYVEKGNDPGELVRHIHRAFRDQYERYTEDLEEKYQDLVENLNDVVFITDENGRMTYLSPVVEQLSGYHPSEIIDRPFTDFIHTEDLPELVESFQKTLNGTIEPSEFRVIDKKGEVHWMRSSSRPILKEQRVVGLRGILTEITDHKRVERDLRHAKEEAEKADRAKSEFLSTMSHELRTPLNIILGYTDLLLEETFGALKHDQATTLQRIGANGKELLTLISSVLDLSRLQAESLPVLVEEVCLQQFLEELQAETQELYEHSELDFYWRLDTSLPTLYTDPGKLKIVLKNLLSNAAKFTQRGSITIIARKVTEGTTISVVDTGIGIPQEDRERIFQPFHQISNPQMEHQTGSGLGLHIVKRLLDLLAGSISVESIVGQGSTFRVWLPGQVPQPLGEAK